MPTSTRPEHKDAIRTAAHPLTGAATDYDRLLSRIGDAGFVLIGEASHGTHDFYHERAQITQRLLEEKHFTAVAVEGTWPEPSRTNAPLRSPTSTSSRSERLARFSR